MKSSRVLTPATRIAAAASPRVCVAVLALFVTSILSAPPTFAASGLGLSGEERWKSEYGASHIAYPPKLLAASAWRAIMSSLEKHFGADASVDAATATAIGTYLEQHARRERHASAATLRITDTAWFRREHDELPAAVWKKSPVMSASNCTACHTAADRGDFHERNIRIPR